MTCVCQLSTADHVLIWSARTWSANRRDWPRVEQEFRGPLGIEAADDLCQGLIVFFSLINSSACRKVSLSPLTCPGVSDDEELLVGLLAEAQRNNWPAAVAMLEQILPPAAIRQALDPVAAIGRILAEAGYPFTRQSPAAAEDRDIGYRRDPSAPEHLICH